MAAVPDMCAPGPAVPHPERRPGAAPSRIVAVTEDLTELRRPESDLARLLDAVGIADLLVACDDRPISTVASYLDYPDYDDDEDDDAPAVVTPIDVLDPRATLTEAAPSGLWIAPEVQSPGGSVAAPPERDPELAGVRVHRLGLPSPLGPVAEPDLVAAMSELVGFDPEPGVYCLAPASAPTDAARGVVIGAAQRIAQV